MRHLGIVASSVLKATAPSVTISAATNYNQNRATLNATISANGASTDVVFQYDTDPNFNNFTEVYASTTPITGQNVSVYANITGLSVNTTYYFRCVAGNSVDNTFSGSLSFKTWSLKRYVNDTVGTTTFTVPTITPTGGSVIAPSISSITVFGGGGGAGYAGGGSGGYYTNSGSESFSNGANTTLTITIGGGGGAQSAGSASSISGTYFTTRTGNGGGGGSGSTIGSGGNSGSGYTGGGGGYGYSYYYDDGGGYWYFDTNVQGAGGGASYNSNGETYDMWNPANGKNGYTAYGGSYSFGSGGRAIESSYGTFYYGTVASITGYGSGGDAINGSGVRGIVIFDYYGP